MGPEQFNQNPFNDKKRPEIALPGGKKNKYVDLTSEQLEKAHKEAKDNADRLIIMEEWIEKSKMELTRCRTQKDVDGVEKISPLKKLGRETRVSTELKKEFVNARIRIINECNSLKGLEEMAYILDEKKVKYDPETTPEIKKIFFDKKYKLILEGLDKVEKEKNDLEKLKILKDMLKDCPTRQTLMMLKTPGEKDPIDVKMVATQKLEKIRTDYNALYRSFLEELEKAKKQESVIERVKSLKRIYKESPDIEIMLALKNSTERDPEDIKKEAVEKLADIQYEYNEKKSRLFGSGTTNEMTRKRELKELEEIEKVLDELNRQ